MTIRFACACGNRLRATDGQSGRQATCPRCGDAVTVPGGVAPLPASGAAPKPRRGDPTTTVVLGALVILFGGVRLATDLAEKRTPFYLPIVFMFAFGLWMVVRGLTGRSH